MEIDFAAILRRWCWLTLAGLVFACLCASLGRLFWGFDLASHFMLYYGIIAAGLVVMFTALRSWKSSAVSAVVLIFAAVQTVPYLLPGKSVERSEVPDEAYRFVAFNLLRQNKETAAVLEYLEEESADVLLLQEVTQRWVRHLKKSMDEMYPYQMLQERNHAFGIWLLSKHPMTNPRMLPSPEVDVPYVSSGIILDGKTVHVVGVHPLPPVGQSKARERNERLMEAGELIGGTGGARMILGDLNCTPWSPHFRKLLRTGGLKDTARGWKYSPTWESGFSWLAIPIDHVLVSDEIKVVRREVGPNLGSDHRPVVVDVLLE